MEDLDESPMADQRVRHRTCPIRSRQTTVGQHLTIQLAFLPFLRAMLFPLPAEGKLKEVEQAPPTPNERSDSFLFDDMYLNKNNPPAKHPFEGVEND